MHMGLNTSTIPNTCYGVITSHILKIEVWAYVVGMGKNLSTYHSHLMWWCGYPMDVDIPLV